MLCSNLAFLTSHWPSWFGENKNSIYKGLPLGGSIQNDALVSTVMVDMQLMHQKPCIVKKMAF